MAVVAETAQSAHRVTLEMVATDALTRMSAWKKTEAVTSFRGAIIFMVHGSAVLASKALETEKRAA